MKSILLSILMAVTPQVFAKNNIVEAEVPVKAIYSPKGFDSNDTAEVVITGWLPNLCYKSPHISSKVEGNNIYIQVVANLNRTKVFCAEVILPFVERVRVGSLDKGEYKIIVNKDSTFTSYSKMTVEQADDSLIDDFTYANVDYIDKGRLGDGIVTLKAYNPSTCFQYDRVEIIDDGENTFSILPIMKKVSDHCPMKMTPLSIEVQLPDTLDSKRVLLHVRSMNGNSVNTLLSNDFSTNPVM